MHRYGLTPIGLLYMAMVLTCPVTVRANGQVSHVWISLKAVTHLPEGELKRLLSREDLKPMLMNGSMFPDGGYAVSDGYGESAHWEPFQSAYLAWVKSNFSPPWDGEGARHVAFLMGMASHGMADQIYDSMYMERAKVHDAGPQWQTHSMDEATDAMFAYYAGAPEVPEQWVPAAEMAALFQQALGHHVTAEKIEEGQNLVRIALWGVGLLANSPQAIADYRALFPWAAEHQLDPAVPGNPPCEAEVVALYWQRLWKQLNGAISFDAPLMARFPREGQYGHPRSAASIESMVSFVVDRGLKRSTVNTSRIVVTNSQGQAHPVKVSLFYGTNSHVINVRPRDDWEENQDYKVTVKPGLETFDGLTLTAPLHFTFTTRPPPDRPITEIIGGGGCHLPSDNAGAAQPWMMLMALILGLFVIIRKRG